MWTATTIDPAKAMYITGAPEGVPGQGADRQRGHPRSARPRGYVTAYDAETGAQAWRFWIVPGNPADGFENAAMEMGGEDLDRRVVGMSAGGWQLLARS